MGFDMRSVDGLASAFYAACGADTWLSAKRSNWLREVAARTGRLEHDHGSFVRGEVRDEQGNLLGFYTARFSPINGCAFLKVSTVATVDTHAAQYAREDAKRHLINVMGFPSTVEEVQRFIKANAAIDATSDAEASRMAPADFVKFVLEKVA